jgi:hypothetical protein
MTRMEALEAVVKAARAWQQTNMHIEPHSNEECEAYERFEDALHALDALRADPAPAGEVVAWMVAWQAADGYIELSAPGSPASNRSGKWTRLGTVRLPLTEGGV